ncbi:MAG: hypothetical protein EXS31_11925 [Pedosphaera sp.]|nr:hypothetical protein [Pedosphaera sp.]
MRIESSKFLPASLTLLCVSGTALLSLAQSPSGNGQARTTEQYHQFAMTHDGDALQGVKLFMDEQRGGCSRCHPIDGHGIKAGPDLSAVGDQFARRDLIDAVLMPSATIAVGYSSTLVETKSGEE